MIHLAIVFFSRQFERELSFDISRDIVLSRIKDYWDDSHYGNASKFVDERRQFILLARQSATFVRWISAFLRERRACCFFSRDVLGVATASRISLSARYKILDGGNTCTSSSPRLRRLYAENSRRVCCWSVNRTEIYGGYEFQRSNLLYQWNYITGFTYVFVLIRHSNREFLEISRLFSQSNIRENIYEAFEKISRATN